MDSTLLDHIRIAPRPAVPTVPHPPVTRKELTGDHSTWCPGCGDFSVLALYLKLLEKRGLRQDEFVSVSGIGCSSRFPYFVQSHSVHFIHGRSIPLATGVALSRPDLHVFVFGGDGDIFSIGGNHFVHAARKNINLTLVVMDNSVYGLTKKQTSPTSPIGYKSKTDVTGAVDQPLNPVKTALACGASFVARTSSTNPNHLLQMMEGAMDHEGFSFIHCLSECVEFFPSAFDAANPRKGGAFNLIPPDHNLADETAAYKLADAAFPGYFGLFYVSKRPSKLELEAGINAKARAKFAGLKDWQILRKTFETMK